MLVAFIKEELRRLRQKKVEHQELVLDIIPEIREAEPDSERAHKEEGQKRGVAILDFTI